MKKRSRALLGMFFLAVFLINLLGIVPFTASAQESMAIGPPQMCVGADLLNIPVTTPLIPETDVGNNYTSGGSFYSRTTAYPAFDPSVPTNAEFNLGIVDKWGEFVISLEAYMPVSAGTNRCTTIGFGHGGEKISVYTNRTVYTNSSGGTMTFTTGANSNAKFKLDIHIWEDLPDRPGKNAFSIYINNVRLTATNGSTWIGNRITDPPRLSIGTNHNTAVGNMKIYKVDTAARAVEKMLDVIDAVGNVTPGDVDKITEAHCAYGMLTEAQRAVVRNYDVLQAAENAIAPYRANILGATIRTSVPQGLKFGSAFDTDSATADGYSVVGYGTVMLAASRWNISMGPLTKQTERAKYSEGHVISTSGVLEYSVTLINIPEAHYETEIMVRSYVIYREDATGNEYTLYSMDGPDSTGNAFVTSVQKIGSFLGVMG